MATENKEIKVCFSGFDFSSYKENVSKFVKEFAQRANKKGQFLNWVNLPELQITRIDEIYSLADKLRNNTNAKTLCVLGIGGSKHTVEHMLSINGLNIKGDDVVFYSDVDSISFERFLCKVGNVLSANYMVASKSGSTFETKDGFLRIKQLLTDEYKKQGKTQDEAEKLAQKHFIAVTDENAQKSELRVISNENNWIGNLFIHDDVGGRFSAFDDHALFALAYAGMKKEAMKEMLSSALEVSKKSLSEDNFEENFALQEGIFWADAKLKNISTSVHQYMGSVFENTVYWHAQMQNESVKDTKKQIAKVPDAMHHSAEAHFNPENKFAFALTAPCDTGVCSSNANAYIGALQKSYSVTGAFFLEVIPTCSMGLTPKGAGALTQLRAFATVYQEIVEKITKGVQFPEVLDSVLQPHVEFYKKNLKGGVVTPGKIG